MADPISISSPQSIILLGDIAALRGLEVLAMPVNPDIRISIRKLTGKQSFIHFQDCDTHIELGELTPIIPKGNTRLVHQMVLFTHAVHVGSKLPFGLDITVHEMVPVTADSALGSFAVSLVKGVAMVSSASLEPDEIVSQVKHFMQSVKQEAFVHNTACSAYQRVCFIQPEADSIVPIPKDTFIVFSVALTKPSPKRLHSNITKHIISNFKKYQANLEQMAKLAQFGKLALEQSDLLKFGEYINRTQKLLIDFGLVSDQVHSLCIQAILAGALGAKYSIELDSVIIICDRLGIEVKSKLLSTGLHVQELVV